jgi:DNA helicase HerA-like ATPase
VIDPEGEFPTLREKLDLLIVSETGDLRADVRSAGLLARKLAETGVSAVVDIYDLPGKGDPWDKRRAFLAEFITSLMNLPKKSYHPMLVIVDEAHNFAPEDARGENAMRARSAIRSLMSAGRKRGFGGILATQRISKIDKDSIADARNVFIGGTTLDIDQKRAGDILGMNKAEYTSLRELAPGEFYSFGPAIEGKGIIRFVSGKVETTHPNCGP